MYGADFDDDSKKESFWKDRYYRLWGVLEESEAELALAKEELSAAHSALNSVINDSQLLYQRFMELSGAYRLQGEVLETLLGCHSCGEELN